MARRIERSLGITLALLLAGPLAAQTVTGEAVRPLLFAPTGAVVELTGAGGLAADQAEILRQVGAMQPYYGAIAISPDEGIMVEATVAAANHHTTEAASVQALAACEAKRQGAAPCVIVALIRPEGWQPRPVQLSSGATADFLSAYADAPAPRAFAVSPSTGMWGIGTGTDVTSAAVAACVERGAALAPADCTVVFVD